MGWMPSGNHGIITQYSSWAGWNCCRYYLWMNEGFPESLSPFAAVFWRWLWSLSHFDLFWQPDLHFHRLAVQIQWGELGHSWSCRTRVSINRWGLFISPQTITVLMKQMDRVRDAAFQNSNNRGKDFHSFTVGGNLVYLFTFQKKSL